MKLLDFKIVLTESLIGTYNTCSKNHPSVICFVESYFQLVLHYTSQFIKQREENVDTVILERLKTKHIQCNTCGVFVLDFQQYISKLFCKFPY